MGIQQAVYTFFTTGRGSKGLQNSILGWQQEQGYIHPSVTVNWMAIAQDNDIKYLGDIDMQNGFATGKYMIAGGDGVPGIDSFTVTAANGFDAIMGYSSTFSVGGISAQPIAGHDLELFYSTIGGGSTTIQFPGDLMSELTGVRIFVDGVELILDTPWETGAGVTAAGSNTEVFLTAGDYDITWSL
jgi:hypothetical protein